MCIIECGSTIYTYIRIPLSLRLGFAPWSKQYLTTNKWPPFVASIKGVNLFFIVCISTLSPDIINLLTESNFPVRADSHNANNTYLTFKI